MIRNTDEYLGKIPSLMSAINENKEKLAGARSSDIAVQFLTKEKELSDAFIEATAAEMVKASNPTYESKKAIAETLGNTKIADPRNPGYLSRFLQTEQSRRQELTQISSKTNYWRLLIDTGIATGQEELLNAQIGRYFQLFHALAQVIDGHMNGYVYEKILKPLLEEREQAVGQLVEEARNIKIRHDDEEAKAASENQEERRGYRREFCKKLSRLGCICLAVMILAAVSIMFIHGPVQLKDSSSVYCEDQNGDLIAYGSLQICDNTLVLTRDEDTVTGVIDPNREVKNAFGKSTVFYEDGSKGWVKVKGAENEYKIGNSNYWEYDAVVLTYDGKTYTCREVRGGTEN